SDVARRLGVGNGRVSCGLADAEIASPHHVSAPEIPCQPEEQHDNHDEAKKTTAVMRRAPSRTAAVVVATAAAEEQHDYDNQQNRHHGLLLFTREVGPPTRRPERTSCACRARLLEPASPTVDPRCRVLATPSPRYL